jgi:aminoglycoside phosphotransferase (APT) family kinase protein
MRFTHESLTQYLTAKLGQAVSIESIHQVGRGNSRETWFVAYRQANQLRKLTFRLDHPSGAIVPTPLDQEYFLYERLGRTQVPIAKALWWEDGAPYSDRPFYVREQIDGDWNVPHLLDPAPQWDGLRIAICKEHLSKLALVHAVDWRALGFDKWLSAPRGVDDCARNMIDGVIEQYQACRLEPVPILLECAAVLKARAPVAPRVSLCKGTNGLGEEIFRDGKIVAMSDWEEAIIGDPAADIAFTQALIPEINRDGKPVWGMAQALEYYEQVSATHIELAAVRYYGVVRAMKFSIFALQSARLLHEKPFESELRAAWTATEVGNIAKRILAAALGWGEAPPASLFEQINQSVEQVA